MSFQVRKVERPHLETTVLLGVIAHFSLYSEEDLVPSLHESEHRARVLESGFERPQNPGA